MSSAEQRFHAIYDDFSLRVFVYALRHTDRETARDVVADVFLVAWRRVDEVPADALPWLLVVARNTIANKRRSHVRRERLESRLADVMATSAGTAPAAEEVAVDRAAMLQALAELTASEREAVLLIAWDGLTPGAAAQVVGCSRNAFEARLHRARRRLERSTASDPPPPSATPTPLPVLRKAST